MFHRKAPLIALVIVALAVAPGCKKKKPQDEPQAPETPSATQQATPEPEEAPADVEVTEGFKQAEPESAPITEAAIEELNRQGVLKTIYFGFDEYDLSEEAREILRGNSTWLNAGTNHEFRVVIEGHCDERGTIEYNLALGEKRARAVRAYLVDLGIATARVRIVTYGEEQPAAMGHTESAWARNRRAVSLLEK